MAFDLRSEKQKENDASAKKRKQSINDLRYSFVELTGYSQLIGEDINVILPEEGEMFFMERNMSMIHTYSILESGISKRLCSQMIAYVNKFYYK